MDDVGPERTRSIAVDPVDQPGTSIVVEMKRLGLVPCTEVFRNG